MPCREYFVDMGFFYAMQAVHQEVVDEDDFEDADTERCVHEPSTQARSQSCVFLG